MNKYLGYGLWTLGGLVFLAGSGLAYVAMTFDPNEYKPEIIRAVQDSTQRTLKIDGNIKLTFFPSLGAHLGAMTLSEVQSDEEFAAIKSADVSLALWPLLRQQVVVSRVALNGAKLRVVKLRSGKLSVDDLLASKPVAASDGAAAPQGKPVDFDIASVKVADAALIFRDEVTGMEASVSELNLVSGRIADGVPGDIELSGHIQLNEPKLDLSARLKTKFQFDLKQDRQQFDGLDIQINGTALDFTRLSIGVTGEVELHSASGEFSARELKLTAVGSKGADPFEMRLDLPGAGLLEQRLSATGLGLNGYVTAAAGKLDVAASFASLESNLRQFRITGLVLSAGMKQPAQAYDLKLFATANGNIETRQYNLPDMKISLSAIGDQLPGNALKGELNGGVQADLKRQSVQANFAGKLQQSQLKAKAAVNNFKSPRIRYDIEIDQFDADPYLPKTAAGSEPYPATPEQTLNLDFLKPLNLDGSLRIGALKVLNVKMNRLRADLKAKGGVLRLAPFNANLYQGNLASELELNVSRAVPQLAIKAELGGVEIGPLLNDSLQMDFLSGKGNVAVNVVTQGDRASLLQKGLNGKLSLNLADGAVKGINLAKSVRDFGKGTDRTQGANNEEKTDFSEMKASFKIANGVAHNDDLLMKSPFLRVGGKGDINLGNESLDYLVKATITGTSKGQGGKDEVGGLTVPVRLSGPFTALKYKLEFSAMASDAVKQKLRGLMQQPGGEANSGAEDQLKQGLKRLFK